jgi:hypothetical protein
MSFGIIDTNLPTESLPRLEQLKFAFSNNQVVVRTISLDSISGGVAYDYLKVTYPDSLTEVFTYKLGGVGGTTVLTITVVYTTVDKDFVDTVTRS